MAQIDKTASIRHDMLPWDLWAKDNTGEKKRSRTDGTTTKRASNYPSLIYSLLALTIMLPLLWPGYILTLDMAFTPTLPMPDHISSSYLFYAGLHYLNFIFASDLIQKVMLFLILLASGLGIHKLIRYIQTSKKDVGDFALTGAYLAGALYMINPFTYSRFMTGQFAVLLGYALLPFFARALLHFFAVPTMKRALIASLWLVVIGIVSIHSLGLAAVMILAASMIAAWRCRSAHGVTLAAVKYGLIGLVIFVAASGYWLIPMLLGTSNQGQAAAAFGTGDTLAFATAGGDWIGKLGNILQLQGFWAEAENLYILPQEQLPAWAFVVLGFWVLIILGCISLWKTHRSAAAFLAICSAISVVVAMYGISWLPGASGFREPQKFVGVVAMSFALLAGLGAAAALSWAKQKRGNLVLNGLSLLVIVLPVLLTPTMFWGFSGQLSPRQYPADWYEINSQLNQDHFDFKVLSLPWHMYMHYPFAGRVIVNPSDNFFDKPTITSNELEFKNASPTFPDADKKILSAHILPAAPNGKNLGEQLQDLEVKYILLAKTYDYQSYNYLDNQTDLELVAETPNLKLYRNLTYER